MNTYGVPLLEGIHHPPALPGAIDIKRPRRLDEILNGYVSSGYVHDFRVRNLKYNSQNYHYFSALLVLPLKNIENVGAKLELYIINLIKS